MKETERKYLVTDSAWKKLSADRVVNIRQGYLGKSSTNVVRIRVTDSKAFITIKTPKIGFTCDEFEYAIPREDGLQLINLCTAVIEKKRTYVRDEYHQLWEVDQFKGPLAGLIVAEIELPSEDTPIMFPDWIGTDVTDDKRYSNANLVTATLESLTCTSKCVLRRSLIVNMKSMFTW